MGREGLPDEVLHAALAKAIAEGRVSVFLETARLNTPRSPVFRISDTVAPLVVLGSLSLLTLLFFGLIAGMAAMVATVLYQLLLHRHVVTQLLLARTLTLAARGAHAWEVLWTFGGVGLTLRDLPEIGCLAPRGDWRKFVGLYVMREERTEKPPEPAPVERKRERQATTERQPEPAVVDTPEARAARRAARRAQKRTEKQ
ncbi:MAG: hypothetical protein HQL38_03605 [Alphaproteobacteria bacterium]|nr:hypothetical protein [Alphaproteobacteria bacterium]